MYVNVTVNGVNLDIVYNNLDIVQLNGHVGNRNILLNKPASQPQANPPQQDPKQKSRQNRRP